MCVSMCVYVFCKYKVNTMILKSISYSNDLE